MPRTDKPHIREFEFEIEHEDFNSEKSYILDERY